MSVTLLINTQKIKFSIKDLFSKCGQIRSVHRIWSHLLKKSLMENFIFCAADDTTFHACDSDLVSLIQGLEHDSTPATEWFKSNQMKVNNELLLFGYKHEVIWETLTRVKCLKTSNENISVSLLIGT